LGEACLPVRADTHRQAKRVQQIYILMGLLALDPSYVLNSAMGRR